MDNSDQSAYTDLLQLLKFSGSNVNEFLPERNKSFTKLISRRDGSFLQTAITSFKTTKCGCEVRDKVITIEVLLVRKNGVS